MADLATSLVAGGFALGGVLVGQLANRWADTTRWRRDLTLTRVKELRDHYTDVIDAVNAQTVVTGQCMLQMKGFRKEVPTERIEKADEKWRNVLSRSLLIATPEVQLAMRDFDVAREEAALANDSKVWVRCDKALAALESERTNILGKMNVDVVVMNESLARYLIPLRVRVWHRLRNRGTQPPGLTPADDSSSSQADSA